jgi:uncharacterized protein (DUF697 family)
MPKTPDFHDFQRAYEEEGKKQKAPTVLVAGYTGSGKTSVIRAMCGASVVPDAAIGAGLPKTQYFDFYQGKAIRFFDSKGLEPGHTEQAFIDDVQAFVRKVQDDPNVDNHIHLVWYTLQGPGARVTPCDIRLMRELLPASQIALITKADITREKQYEAMTAVLVKEGVAPDRIILCSEDQPESLKVLEDLSYRLLPAAYRQAFAAAQQVNLERKAEQAQRIIHAAAAAAMGVAAAPIPVSDSLLITPIQLSMVAGLAIIYSEPQEGLKAAIMPIIAESVGVQTAASLSKFIPGLGSVISAGVAGALTEAVGQVVNKYFSERCLARMQGRPPPEVGFDLSRFWTVFRDAKK